jgi:hypothetical protein
MRHYEYQLCRFCNCMWYMGLLDWIVDLAGEMSPISDRAGGQRNDLDSQGMTTKPRICSAASPCSI